MTISILNGTFNAGSYLCMISDVQSNVFTIADVAVFNGRSGTLTTYTHS